MQEVVCQLVALVGGAESDRHHIHLNLEHKLHSIEKPEAKSKGFSKSDGLLHKIAGRSGQSQHVAAKSAGKTIPLDVGEEDLREFNN